MTEDQADEMLEVMHAQVHRLNQIRVAAVFIVVILFIVLGGAVIAAVGAQ